MAQRDRVAGVSLDAGDDAIGDRSSAIAGLVASTTATDGELQEIIDTSTLISAIQGAGAATPLPGEVVTVEAIVVGDFQDGVAGTHGDLNGFFLQEEDADADANAMTSEGIFVFDGSNPIIDVAVGDRVRVTGTVNEFFGETQITASSVEVLSSGNALPTAAVITFPVANLVTNADGVMIADLEAYEGMLVTVPQALTVGDLFSLGRFGEIDLSAQGRVAAYTQVSAPSVAGFEAYQEEAARYAITLDDGSTFQNPSFIPFEIAGEPGNSAGVFDAGDDLTSGDTVTGLTGVIRYTRGSGGSGEELFRIMPTQTPVFVDANPREEAAPEVGGSLKVASFNVLNYFTTLGDEGLGSGPGGFFAPRGADDALEFQRQTDKLIAALSEIQADVFGLVEIENEFGDQNGDGEFAIAKLVAELNAATGLNYAYVDPGVPHVGSDAIAVGLIYNADTIRIAEGTTVEILTDSDLAALGLDFGNPVFDGDGTSRAPIAASFEELATGEVFTVTVNHFKSKGSISPFGNNAGTGDGTGNNNEARLQAAIALDAWLDSDPTGSGDGDILIVGDLNAYAMEDPIRHLIAEGYVDLLAASGASSALDYTFGFPLDPDTAPQVQGFGTLDYALASSSLFRQVTGAAEWHINSDEATALDYTTSFKPPSQIAELYAPDPFRSSDHDPVLVGLDLLTRKLIAGTNKPDALFGTDAHELISSGGGRLDVARGDGGSDEFLFVDIEGQRDRFRILDYTPEDDVLNLGGAEIARVRDVGSNLLLELAGADRDQVILVGIDDIDEVTFVGPTAFA